MPKPEKVFKVFVVFLLIFLFIDFALITTYNSESCSYQEHSTARWEHCDFSIPISCNEPAHILHIHDILTPVQVNEIEVICPWRLSIYYFSYFSFVLSITFIIMTNLDSSVKSKRIISLSLVIGFLATGCVSMVVVQMILDIAKGRDAVYNDPFVSDFSVIEQKVFITHAVSFMLTFLTIFGLLIFAIKFGAGLIKQIPQTTSTDYEILEEKEEEI